MKWYAQKAGNDTQGLIADEATGRTVAVAYDHKDTALLAAAPELLSALKATLESLENWVEIASEEDRREYDYEAIRAAHAAIAKAKED